MTPEEIKEFCTAAFPMATAFIAACDKYEINTPARVAAFMAQMAEESMGFTHLVENLNYSAAGLVKTWPRHFTADEAEEYAHQPEKIANHAYASRDGNGDETSGDGWRYRGRGFPMLTGRTNYVNVGKELGLDLVNNPDLASTPAVAPWVGACYWNEHSLNELADALDFAGITREINGGMLGEVSRETWYAKAKAVWPF